MSDGKKLRSGKTTGSPEESEASSKTTETNTWSHGTGTEERSSDSTQQSSDQVNIGVNGNVGATELQVETSGNSAPGTVVGIPVVRDGPGIEIPASQSSKLSHMKAQLELRASELEQARAATAYAEARLELARYELATVDNSNEAEVTPNVDNGRIQSWINDQSDARAICNSRDCRTQLANVPPCADTSALPNKNREYTSSGSDMAALADAIVKAVSLNKPNNQATALRFMEELPYFDGNVSDWIAFKSVFADTRDSYTGVQNVARLRKALRGQAKETVRSLMYTSTEPSAIIETLERRYGRPEVLILTELESLKKLPRMFEDGKNIGTFASKVANTVASIKTLNQSQYLYSPELVSKVVDKLSIILRYKWCEFKSMYTDIPELVLLSQFLNKIADQCSTIYNYEIGKEERTFNRRPKPVCAVKTIKERSPSNSSDSSSISNYERESKACKKKATVATTNHKSVSKKHRAKFTQSTPRNQNEAKTFDKGKCATCGGNHVVKDCADFKKLDVATRWETAKRFRLCYRCLGEAHGRMMRCKYVPCGMKGCEASHHQLLHHGQESNPRPVGATVSSVNHISCSKAYLKILPIELNGPLGTITTHALLDEGSTMTLIEREVAHKIVPPGRSERLSIEVVGGSRVDDFESSTVKMNIRGLCSRELESITAHTIGTLDLSPQEVNRDLILKCEHLLKLEDELCYDEAKPTVIIGQDNWHLIVSRQLRVGNKAQPVASLTKLGWVLHGQDSRPRKYLATVNHIKHVTSEDPALALIREHFSIESLGIEPRKPAKDPEERALKLLDSTCTLIPGENRYEAGLLWRSDNEVMPENRNQTLRRLHNLENKLDKNESLKREYNKQIENLIEKGYAERVESPSTSPRLWYLPHFAVTHPQKGKVRLVFDAASKTAGKCLNDALLTGPDLLQSLFGVLVRFREGRIAVVADIKEMFLQVKIIERDRDSLRFLWRGEDRNNPPQEYRMTSLIFGAASSPCTAIYVKNKNADCHKHDYPEIARATVRNFYMDDYLGVFDTVDQAKTAVVNMSKVHAAASFELRGWASNEPDALSGVTDTTNNRQSTTVLGKSEYERTLGLIWNHRRDTIGFCLNLRNTPVEIIEGETPPTKRQITSAVMSVFDPLGLAAPVTITGKMLIQDVWRTGVGWDDTVSTDQHAKWKAWLRSLSILKELNIPRYIPKPSDRGEGELHVFCDASEKGYAAAVYLVTTQFRIRQSHLLAAKARVTPLKPISIPRLELQAAVLGCRLINAVKKETDYKIGKCFHWTDSRTVLAWIKADPRTFKSFVAHRLAEIESLTAPTNWHWVPTSDNVADDATRGTTIQFDSNHRWFTGPEFLKREREFWPIIPTSNMKIESSGEERRAVNTIVVSRINDHLPDPSRFSSYNRLLRATARLLLAAEVFKTQRLRETQSYIKDVSTRHILVAERMLLLRCQDESFHEERRRLAKHEPVPRSSKLKRLTVKLQADSLISLDGRYKLNGPPKQEQPLVLDAKHTITRLLIDHYHVRTNHGNNHTVINELQQKFHIIGLRNYIRNIRSKCQWCIVYGAKPMRIQEGDLPPERLRHHQPPFTAVGVDYFGPMTVTIGRRTEKRWGALYTCLTTRAVHIELANSLSASSMILTLRRFMSRRGTPTVIYSDNGTNFVGAEREIREAIDASVVENFATTKRIVWKRIPPGAPNMGGAWESLVKSIKRALNATLKSRAPHEEVLHTLLLEAEHMVNSRPLTPINCDLTEEALTPNHFLIQRSSGLTPFGSFHDKNTHAKSWQDAQALADRLWSKWLKEYKPLLLPRKNNNSSHSIELKEGDVVLIVDNTMPRGTWPRGQIDRAHPGPDGKTRVVEVRTPAGMIRRPASRVILLDRPSLRKAVLTHEGETVAR